MNINQIAAVIAKNNAGEQSAIEGYYEMISDAQGLPQQFIDEIHEIISDEMHHSQRLSYWVEYLTGVKPALT